MGLAWQQGPLATRSVGQFLLASRLPERLLFAEPLPRRMCVRFGGQRGRARTGDAHRRDIASSGGRRGSAFASATSMRSGLRGSTRTCRARPGGTSPVKTSTSRP
jgi:hypothetical protein